MASADTLENPKRNIDEAPNNAQNIPELFQIMFKHHCIKTSCHSHDIVYVVLFCEACHVLK